MSKTKTAPMPKEQTQHDREIRDLNAEAARLRAETAKLNAETAQRQAENTKAIAELRASNAETAKQLAQLGTTVKATEKTNAETAKQLAELRQFIADIGVRADKALAVAEKNNEYFGNHIRNEGELLEMECYNALMKTKTVNGVKLDGFQPGPKDPHHGVEIDLIGFNGKVTMPIEVKRTMSPADVRRFAEVRMERFAKAFPYLARGKEVIPVIIFAMPRTGVDADGKPEDPVKLALKLGLTVLQSIGENQLSPITAPDQVISRPHETTDLT